MKEDCIFSGTPRSTAFVPPNGVPGAISQGAGAYSPFSQPFDPFHQEWQFKSPSPHFQQSRQPGQPPKGKGRPGYADQDVTSQQPFNPQPIAPNKISQLLQNAPEYGNDEYEAYRPSPTFQNRQRSPGPQHSSNPDFQLAERFAPQDWAKPRATLQDHERQVKGLSILDAPLPESFFSLAPKKPIATLRELQWQVRLPSVLDLPLPQSFGRQARAEPPAIQQQHERQVIKEGEKSGHDFQSKLRKQPEVSREPSELPDASGLSIRSQNPSCSPTVSSDIEVVSVSGDSEGTDLPDRNSPGFRIFNRVFHRLAVLGQHEVKLRGESSGCSSKGKQPAKSGSASSSGTRDGTSLTRARKNQRQDDDRGNDGRDKRNDPPSKRGKISHSQCEGRPQFLACPYWKQDPEKYWDCFLKKNDTIAHLKQHLTRRHTPKYYCQICYETFKDFSLFDSHVLERSCMRGPSAKLEGISQQKKNKLSLKSKGSVEQQWYTVWSILFPDTDPPATIYIHSTQSEDFCRIQEFAQREGVAIMLDELDSSGLIVRHDTSNQQLRSTVQRAMVSIFRSYSIRREPNLEEAEEPSLNQCGESAYGTSLQQQSPPESQTGQADPILIDLNQMMADGTDNSILERFNRPNSSTWSQLPTMTPWLSREAVQDHIEEGPWAPTFFEEPALGVSSARNDLAFNIESSDMLDLDALLRDVINTEA
jgi:hypothetical protein